jgi:hypothetical protein
VLGAQRGTLVDQAWPVIIVIEGPSAVGKTTWCRTHAPRWIPEPSAGPLDAVLAAQRRRWRDAVEIDAGGQDVVLDGDPLKLWYTYAELRLGDVDADAWAAATAATTADVAAGALGFADVVCYADPGIDELVRRRAGDPTRTRRNFERHTAMRPYFRQWYESLAAIDPDRVIWEHPASGITPALAALGRRSSRSDPDMLAAVVRGVR